MAKYRNKKVTRIVNGKAEVFDSIKEASRFDQLYLLLKAKKITKLVIQPSFVLMDTQTHNGKTYSKVKYIADFRYEKDGKTYVEDVKSEATRKLSTYRVKIKWWVSLYGNTHTFLET